MFLALAVIIALVSYKFGGTKTDDPVTDVDFRLPGYALSVFFVYMAYKNI